MSFSLAYVYQVTSHIRRVTAVDRFSLAYQSLSHSRQALSDITPLSCYFARSYTTKMFRWESSRKSKELARELTNEFYGA